MLEIKEIIMKGMVLCQGQIKIKAPAGFTIGVDLY